MFTISANNIKSGSLKYFYRVQCFIHGKNNKSNNKIKRRCLKIKGKLKMQWFNKVIKVRK